MRESQISRIGCALAILLLVATSALAQTDTSSTYQGRLLDDGEPASGSYNIDVSLWNALSGGGQIGSTIMFNGLAVTDGLFSVELDFGASAFDNAARWLEISVNGNELSPRQPITRTPYSIQTRGIFVDANNNVGIGTTTPQSLLQVGQGDEASIRLGLNPQLLLERDVANNKFRIQLTGSGYGGRVLQIGRDDQTHDIAMMGNVGIGTTTPSAKLNVVGDGAVAVMKLTNGGSSANTALLIGDVGGTGKAASFFGVTSSDLIRVENNGTGNTALFIATQNHAIETIATGNANALRATHTGTAGSLSAVFGESQSTNGRGVYGFASTSSGANFGIYGRSDSTSGLGVYGLASATSGTTSGVRGAAQSGDGIAVAGKNFSPDGNAFGVYGQSDSNSGIAIRAVTTHSDFGFGVWSTCASSHGADFAADGAGVHYLSASSRRWKKNIEKIQQPLDKISQLRGVYYDMDKEHGGRHDIGMIAEDVGAVLPEIVVYEENGIDAVGMDYSKLTPLLVEAVNALRAEQSSEIKTLRAEKDREITSLRAENVKLHQRLVTLESLVQQLANRAQEEQE